MAITNNFSEILVKYKTQIFLLTMTMGFAALTAIGARFEIPAYPVPFTLQSFFVLLSGVVLGKRFGASSQILYLLIGAAGLPVFSSGGFGLMKIFGPTGGYLLSFPLVAFLVGYAVEKSQGFWWILGTMFISTAVLFTLGMLHLNFFYIHNVSEAFEKGFLLFSLWDVVKLLSAAGIAHQILNWKKIKG